MQKFIFTLLIAVTSVVVFWQVKDADFVWGDRQEVFADAPPLPARQQLQEAWQWQPHSAYAPISDTVWALMRLSSGESEDRARLYHLLSLSVHALSAILVFLILSLCLENLSAAFIGSLFFALHPLQVEAVAYLGAFRFLLAGFFALFALWQYLRYVRAREVDGRRRSNPLRHYYIATGSFLLGMLTLPSVVVVPLIAMVLERLLPRRSSFIKATTPAWPLSLWLLLALPVCILTVISQNTEALAQQTPIWSRPIIAADALSFYASKLFVPAFIGPDYGRSPNVLADNWWGFVTWIFPVCLLMVLAYWRGKARIWYLAAVSLLVIALLPFLGLFHFEAQSTSTVANRFAYLAMLGPALALAYTVSMPKRSWLSMLAVCAVAVCGWLSYRNVRHWQNDEALLNHAININPASPMAHEILGHRSRALGQWKDARAHYQKVLAVNATNPDIYYYLGEIERQHGDASKAIEFYTETLHLDSNYKRAYSSLGLAQLAVLDFEGALSNFRKAVELDPDDHEPMHHLGMLYVQKKAYADAVPFLTRALEYGQNADRKQRAATYALLGLALANTQQPERAQGFLEQALQLDPSHIEANRTLADIYFAQGKYQDARARYQIVINSPEAKIEVFHNLGIILSLDKKYDLAVQQFGKALELQPDAVDTQTNMGIALFHLRRFKEAQEHFNHALELKPDAADPYYYLGDIARWQGNQPVALSYYYRALKIEPNHSDANYRLGNYFMQQNKMNQAIRHYQAALKQAPEDPKLLYRLRLAEKALEAGAPSADGSAM